jgi:hypothetical protein
MNARHAHKMLKKRGYELRPADDAHMGVYTADGQLIGMTLMPGRKGSKEITFAMKKLLREVDNWEK